MGTILWGRRVGASIRYPGFSSTILFSGNTIQEHRLIGPSNAPVARRGLSLDRLLPRIHAQFGLWREHRGLQGDGNMDAPAHGAAGHR